MDTKTSYKEHLNDPRWIKKWDLSRDSNTCQFCGAQDRYLHVHHRQYWNGFLPWEYPDGILITLCDDCHYAMHNVFVGELDGIRVGDIYGREHSDYHNTGIVYAIDSVNKLIYTLESDDGVSEEELYDECNTLKDFKKTYDKEEYEYSWNGLFPYWLVYIDSHLERTPLRFRYFYRDVIKKNKTLQYILGNKEIYTF